MDEHGRPETLAEASAMLNKAIRDLIDSILKAFQEVWERRRQGGEVTRAEAEQAVVRRALEARGIIGNLTSDLAIRPEQLGVLRPEFRNADDEDAMEALLAAIDTLCDLGPSDG